MSDIHLITRFRSLPILKFELVIDDDFKALKKFLDELLMKEKMKFYLQRFFDAKVIVLKECEIGTAIEYYYPDLKFEQSINSVNGREISRDSLAY